MTVAVLQSGSRAATSHVRIRRSIPAGVDGAIAIGLSDHVDIGVVGRFTGNTSADFEHPGVPVRAVLQTMPIGVSGREPGRIAGAQHLFSAVSDQHHLAGEDIDELVAAGMPVALARPGARRQAKEIDAELRQSGSVAEFNTLARAAGHVERRWVKGADDRSQRGSVHSFFHRTCSLISQPAVCVPRARTLAPKSIRWARY